MEIRRISCVVGVKGEGICLKGIPYCCLYVSGSGGSIYTFEISRILYLHDYLLGNIIKIDLQVDVINMREVEGKKSGSRSFLISGVSHWRFPTVV